MSDGPEPLSRHVGGSGTYADPHRFHSALLTMLDRMQPGGDYFHLQLDQARELLVRTEVSDDLRKTLEERILDLEYRWRCGLPAYVVGKIRLVKESAYSFKPKETAARKRAELLRQAHEAREAFYAFAQEHPAIHERRGCEVPTIEELLA